MEGLNHQIDLLKEKAVELKEMERKMQEMAEMTIKLRADLTQTTQDKNDLEDQYTELENRFQVFISEYDEMRNQFDSLRIM